MAKKHLLSLYFIIILAFTASAQDIKIISIPMANDGDTLNACQNSTIILQALKTDSTNLDSGSYYEWSYGNTIKESGTDLDSVSTSYENGGGYFVLLRTITLNKDTFYAQKYIRIGIRPYFTDSKTDLDTASVCFDGKNNDIVGLSAKVIHREWKYDYPYKSEAINAMEINSGKPYIAGIEHEIYNAKEKIKLASEIDTIGVLMEHSNAADIEISIICPSGKSIKLKQFGNKKDFLGEPVTNPILSDTEGKLYWYYFTEKLPNYGTMQQEEQQHFNSFTDNADSVYTNEPYYPQGSYLPAESFSGLAGCPFNGKWTMAILDNAIPDNGYIKAWTLIFDSIPPLKSYINSDKSYLWSSNSAAQIVGDSSLLTAKAEPQIKNVFANIKFTLTDNYSCAYDTSLLFEIQPASATATPNSGEADLEVQFNSTTRWKDVSFSWDFANGNSTGNENSPTNTYTEKGDYDVIFTATSASGCVNYDTLAIKVTAPVSSVEGFNAFSPNNDGINDRFIPKTEGLRNGRLIIYDRSGKKLADLSTLEEVEKGWDGTLHNSGNRVMKPGLYFYTIIAEGKDDVKHKKSGALHLFWSK